MASTCQARIRESCCAIWDGRDIAFCEERRIPWSRYGNWTLDDESEDAGVEPDECYIFGATPETKPKPELALEVVWTSGGINKLEIYRRLGVGEVWFWKDGQISVHVLVDNAYEARTESAAVPGIDLSMLCELVSVTPTSEAREQLRERIRT